MRLLRPIWALLALALLSGGARGDCGFPPRFSFAELRGVANNSFPVGTRLRYYCRSGYTYNEGKPPFVTCTETSTWLADPEFCVGKPCKPLEVANGRVEFTSLRFGATVSFSCDDGYRRIGSASAHCVIRGNGVDWDKEVPFCETIPCLPPPNIAHGSHSRLGEEEFAFGSAVTYSCDKGFSLIGEASIHCTTKDQVNGEWSGPAPECKVVRCPELQIKNGKKQSGFGPNYSYGDTIVIECDPGYTLSDNPSVKCEANSSWVPSLLACQRKSCGHPGELKNGRVIETDFLFGSVVHFTCEEGHQLIGQPDRRCEISGTDVAWSGDMPICERKSCGHPGELKNGRVIETDFLFGSVVHFTCENGHRLIGRPDRQCEISGTDVAWSGDVPFCERKSCGHPGELKNGSVIETDFLFGSAVHFTCEGGHQLIGQPDRRCEISGTDVAWSGNMPFCKYILCHPPPDISHGKYTGVDFSYGLAVTYSCNGWYRLIGEASIYCTTEDGVNGVWRAPPPYCSNIIIVVLAITGVLLLIVIIIIIVYKKIWYKQNMGCYRSQENKYQMSLSRITEKET